MKTIKSKILIPTLSLFIICTIILSAFTISGIYLSTMSALEESMDATVTTATQVIQNQLTAYENIAQMLTVEESLTQTLPDVNSPEYAAVRADIVLSAAILAKSQNFKFIKVLDKDGIDIESGFGVGPAEFFTIPKNEGRTYISNPIVYESTGNLEMYVTAPIIKDGEFAGVILCIIDPSVFSEIAANINIGTSGHATIINKEGTTIAYHDIEFVRNQYNAVKEYETDPSLASLVKLEQDLLAGNSGFGSYTQDGESRIMAYSPIEGTDGWGMYVTASQQEFLSQMYMSSFASLTLGVIIILVAAFVMIRLTTKIVKPAVQATQQLPAIANGDFTVELTGNGTDEIAKIVELFNDTIQKTRKSLNNMKTEAGTLEGIGNKLAEDASQAASAVHEIASNVDSIKGQVINESAGVNQIHATIGQIVNHIEGLDARE
ncbi:MAG: methyl-accepting chemotaxis protein, partial [Spirochaetales bacterium]